MGESMVVYVGRDLDRVLVLLDFSELVKAKKIVVKINMVSPTTILSMTPLDSVDRLLHFLRDKLSYTGDIIIAEGSAGDTWVGFRRGGFDKIAKKYEAELFDIHDDDYYLVKIFDREFNKFSIPISKLLVDSEALISICRAKTHDTVVVTLSIKNVAVGGIVGVDNRPKIHQGYQAININIAILGAIMYPDISIIDGRVGMQGNGPVFGYEKKWGYVFCGTSPLHVDSTVAEAMGFSPRDIGYIYYLEKFGFGKINEVEIRGFSLEEIRTKFEPHSTYNRQLKWRPTNEIEEKIIQEAKNIIKDFGLKNRVFPRAYRIGVGSR